MIYVSGFKWLYNIVDEYLRGNQGIVEKTQYLFLRRI